LKSLDPGRYRIKVIVLGGRSVVETVAWLTIAK